MLNHFHYKNYDPDFDTRVLAESVLQRLEDAAPYSSSILGMVEKTPHGFSASIDIRSEHGTFLATAQGTQIESVLYSLESKMKSKLSHWVNTRFERIKSSNWFRHGENFQKSAHSA